MCNVQYHGTRETCPWGTENRVEGKYIFSREIVHRDCSERHGHTLPVPYYPSLFHLLVFSASARFHHNEEVVLLHGHSFHDVMEVCSERTLLNEYSINEASSRHTPKTTRGPLFTNLNGIDIRRSVLSSSRHIDSLSKGEFTANRVPCYP